MDPTEWRFSTFMMLIIYAAIIFVIVQPGGNVARVVTNITTALVNFIEAAIKGEVK